MLLSDTACLYHIIIYRLASVVALVLRENNQASPRQWYRRGYYHYMMLLFATQIYMRHDICLTHIICINCSVVTVYIIYLYMNICHMLHLLMWSAKVYWYILLMDFCLLLHIVCIISSAHILRTMIIFIIISYICIFIICIYNQSPEKQPFANAHGISFN